MAERMQQPPGITQGDIGARYTRKRLSDEVYIGHYIKAGDRIRVRSTILAGVIASLTTVNLTIGGRVQGMDGDLVPFGDSFTLTADGVQTAQYVMAPEGYVVDLIVQSTSTGLTSGDLTVIVDIVQGVGSNAVAVGLLAYGYVYPAGLLGLNVSRNIGGGGGMAIGGTVTSGTAGSVLFVGSGPVLAQDNANFFYDDTANSLRVGPADATYLAVDTADLFVGNSGAEVPTIVIRGANAAGSNHRLSLIGSRGTIASPAVTQSGDSAGEIDFATYDTGGFFNGKATIQAKAGADPATDGSGLLEMYTADSGFTIRERLRLTGVGSTGVATPSANTSVAIAGQLEVQSSVVLHKGVTFANLPASPVAGMVAYITDSNAFLWGATIAGGSTNKVLGWYNGTNWTVVGA